MRAFRPSHFAPADECEEDQQRAKDENLELYTKRAEAGMPLFEAIPSVGDVTPRRSNFTARE